VADSEGGGQWHALGVEGAVSLGMESMGDDDVEVGEACDGVVGGGVVQSRRRFLSLKRLLHNGFVGGVLGHGEPWRACPTAPTFFLQRCMMGATNQVSVGHLRSERDQGLRLGCWIKSDEIDPNSELIV
jgi:hypothetical protein